MSNNYLRFGASNVASPNDAQPAYAPPSEVPDEYQLPSLQHLSIRANTDDMELNFDSLPMPKAALDAAQPT